MYAVKFEHMGKFPKSSHFRRENSHSMPKMFLGIHFMSHWGTPIYYNMTIFITLLLHVFLKWCFFNLTKSKIGSYPL